MHAYTVALVSSSNIADEYDGCVSIAAHKKTRHQTGFCIYMPLALWRLGIIEHYHFFGEFRFDLNDEVLARQTHKQRV